MKNQKLAPYVKPAIITLISLILIIAATFTGCQLSSITDKTPSNSEIKGETDINKDIENEKNEPQLPPVQPIVLYNVLTGLKTTSELADLRPVAICIENTPYAMPQYGISNAQLLIEVPLADGTTRLMMLTTDYNQVTTIGPVSSTTSYLLELGNAFQAIQCFNGSYDSLSEEILSQYDSLDYASGTLAGVYYTDPTRFSEKDLMTNGILLDTGVRREEINATYENPTNTPYTFVDESSVIIPTDGTANKVSVSYSNDLNVVYTYHEATQTYIRSQYGTTQLDGNNGAALSFDNLFILHASTITYSKEDSTSLDLVIEDGGSGYYISRGNYEMITWKQNTDGSITFLDADGNVLVVNRGTSYIGMVAADKKDSVVLQ